MNDIKYHGRHTSEVPVEPLQWLDDTAEVPLSCAISGASKRVISSLSEVSSDKGNY